MAKVNIDIDGERKEVDVKTMDRKFYDKLIEKGVFPLTAVDESGNVHSIYLVDDNGLIWGDKAVTESKVNFHSDD